MQYKIVYAQDKYLHSAIEKLEKQVKNLMNDGWEPVGGVSVIKPYETLTDHEVFQAMIKE